MFHGRVPGLAKESKNHACSDLSLDMRSALSREREPEDADHCVRHREAAAVKVTVKKREDVSTEGIADGAAAAGERSVQGTPPVYQRWTAAAIHLGRPSIPTAPLEELAVVATEWPGWRGSQTSTNPFVLVPADQCLRVGARIKIKRSYALRCAALQGARDPYLFTSHGFRSGPAAHRFLQVFSALAVPVLHENPGRTGAARSHRLMPLTRGWMCLLDYLWTEGLHERFSIDRTITMNMHSNVSTWHQGCRFERDMQERMQAFAMVAHRRLGQLSAGSRLDSFLLHMVLTRPAHDTMQFREGDYGGLFMGLPSAQGHRGDAWADRDYRLYQGYDAQELEASWDEMSLLDAAGWWEHHQDGRRLLDTESKLLSMQLVLLAGATVTQRARLCAGLSLHKDEHLTSLDQFGPAAEFRTMLDLVGSAQERLAQWPLRRALLLRTARADQPAEISRLFLDACGGKDWRSLSFTPDNHDESCRDAAATFGPLRPRGDAALPSFVRFLREPYFITRVSENDDDDDRAVYCSFRSWTPFYGPSMFQEDAQPHQLAPWWFKRRQHPWNEFLHFRC